MALFRWALLLAGIVFVAGIFTYSRGWLTLGMPGLLRRKQQEKVPDSENPEAEADVATIAAEEPAKAPLLPSDSLVVTVRIMPQPGQRFPAEQLVLIMRGTGLQHGRYGIFHRLDESDASRIRFSVASLIEPGAFDLTKLKESFYKGVSIFMVLPAAEDGVALFDEMLETARTIARGADGRLVDEDGSVLSVQRERFMREEVLEFLRRRGGASVESETSPKAL